MTKYYEDTMHYTSPAHGGWGIVRVGMLIPESYQLFVCPFACGRHGAIGAIHQEFKNRLSYVYIEQSDVISGYDELIIKSVGELLKALPEKPKVLLIMLSCLDDLIGTDTEALVETLEETYSGIKFATGKMNPLSADGKTPPDISIQRNLYSVLEPTAETDQGINLIGNLTPINPQSELFEVLAKNGYDTVRHITDYQKFDDYQDMAKSKLNIVLAPTGKKAAEDMEKKHGMPNVFMPVSYRIEDILQEYRDLFDVLGLSYDEQFFQPYIDEVQKSIEETRKVVGDFPIVVDTTACTYAFELARALTEYGFNVRRVVNQKMLPLDKEHFEWLIENDETLEIQQPQHHNTIKFENQMPESLSIGIDAAYITASKYVAQLFNNQGVFGFYAVQELMRLMREGMKEEANLQAIIDSYGLVV